jgi:hypothetical protein
MVVKSVEHDQENTYPRREAKNSLLGEAIRLEFPILESTDGVLLGLPAPIKRGKIKITARH